MISRDQEQLLALLALSYPTSNAHNALNVLDADDVDWLHLYDMAAQHGILGLCFEGIQKWKELDAGLHVLDPVIFAIWYDMDHTLRLKFNRMWESTKSLMDLFAANGLRMLAVKGYSFASLYPKPILRPSCDLDCFVLNRADGQHDTGYEQSIKVLEQENVSVDKSIYIHSTFDYNNLHVENHRFLTAVKGNKRLRKLETLLDNLLSIEGTEELGTSGVEIPGKMHTLLYMTYHAQKHLLKEQVNMKMICDFAMFWNKYNVDFDWKQYWEYCKEYGMEKFACSVFLLVDKLLSCGIPPGLQPDIIAPEAVDLLLDYVLNEEGCNRSSNIWVNRLNLLLTVVKARKRYKMYSDMGTLSVLSQLVIGRITKE